MTALFMPSSEPSGPIAQRASGAVLYAGGGTGGHLFPALAVAEAVHAMTHAKGDEKKQSVLARFVCSTRAIDAKILNGAKIGETSADFAAIHAFPVSLRPLALYRFISNWGLSVRESRGHIRAMCDACGGDRSKVVVAAFGGFVAAPVVQAARAQGVKVLMVNLDAVPGRANMWIARRLGKGRNSYGQIVTAAQIVSAAQFGTADATSNQESRFTHWERVGPIVRRVGLAPASREVCRGMLGLDANIKTLLITGGSQGATSINELIIALLAMSPEIFNGWQVVHQCGGSARTGSTSTSSASSSPKQRLIDAYARAKVPAVVEEFVTQMGVAWGAAECAIGRAGAGTVAEAWANCVPTIFMPYPYHADQHQRANAMPLHACGGGVLVVDAIEAQANARGLAGRAILEVLGAETLRETMRGALRALGPANGAERVAAKLVSMLG